MQQYLRVGPSPVLELNAEASSHDSEAKARSIKMLVHSTHHRYAPPRERPEFDYRAAGITLLDIAPSSACTNNRCSFVSELPPARADDLAHPSSPTTWPAWRCQAANIGKTREKHHENTVSRWRPRHFVVCDECADAGARSRHDQ